MRRLLILALLLGAHTTSAQERCLSYRGERAATLDDERLTEASGLAFSARRDDLLYAHNDSGADSTLFLLDTSGAVLSLITVPGTTSRDWEDIELGPCDDGALECLYIGDFGNNNVDRDDLALYRVREPADPTTATTTERAERFPFRYPDGNHNAETLLIHPSGDPILIVTKHTTGASGVYRVPTPLTPGVEVELERLTSYTFGSIPLLEQATTGGSFTRDGHRFIIRSYVRAYEFLYTGDVAADMAAEATDTLLMTEEQGEAITYAPDGLSFWTTTEKIPAPMHRFSCERFSGEGEDTDAEDTSPPGDADGGAELTPDTGDAPDDCACALPRKGPRPASTRLWLLVALLAWAKSAVRR